MCNISLPSNNSASSFEENHQWFMYCVCQGYFGTYVLIGATVLFSCVGTPAHFLSLWMFTQVDIKPNLVFPLNFTLVDLTFCVLSFTDIAATLVFSLTSFQLSLYLTTLCWTVRPLLQMCICIEQYLAVVHPVVFLRYKGVQHRIALALVVWILGVGNGLRLIFNEQNFFPDHVFFLIFWVAAIIISFCCGSVLHALKRSGPGDTNKTTNRDKSSNPEGGRAVGNQQKCKAFRIISYSLLSILVCYVPQEITYILSIVEISKEIFLCNVFTFNLSISVFTLLIVNLLTIYKGHNLKHKICFTVLGEN